MFFTAAASVFLFLYVSVNHFHTVVRTLYLHLLLHISGNSLAFKAMQLCGSILDQFEVQRRQVATD